MSEKKLLNLPFDRNKLFKQEHRRVLFAKVTTTRAPAQRAVNLFVLHVSFLMNVRQMENEVKKSKNCSRCDSVCVFVRARLFAVENVKKNIFN